MTAIERLQALAAAHTETYVTVPAEDLREVCAARPDDPLARTLLTIAANAEHTPTRTVRLHRARHLLPILGEAS